MLRKRRRHNTGFGYIGFGNNSNVFNRKPRKVFSEIKDKLKFESQKSYHLNFIDRQLSEEEKLEIKNKIRKQQNDKVKLSLLIIFVSTLLVILIIIFFGT